MTKTRLPVVGSSASTTAFCVEQLTGPGGFMLFLDGNGKVTAGNGTVDNPRPNALSLPAAAISSIDHCPGSTPTCRKACYVGPLSRAQQELYSHYERNANNLREILADEYLANAWCMHLANWITLHASGGFRWHVSGDVTSIEHARWIADVCRESPTVRHWIYTRSFDFLEPLAEVCTLRGGNLALNLSADADNLDTAIDRAIAYGTFNDDVEGPAVGKDLRICYLTVDGTVPDELGVEDVIFPDYNLRPRQHATLAESEWWASLSPGERGLVCPVDAHGKSEKIRCGLERCSRCLA